MLTSTQYQQPPEDQGAPPTPPPPPGFQGGALPGMPGVIDDIASLQSLAEQVAALRAQQRVLVAQTHSRDPGVAMSAQSALPGVEMELAKTNIELEILRARIRARQNQQYQGGQRPGRDPVRPNADQITIMALAFILAVMMPISIAISRRIFRRGSTRAADSPLDTISPRLDRIEQAVDAVAIEVERISEGQRFVTKVLVERPAQARASTARAATVSGSHDAPSHNTPKPFLALGAGPIEPIRVPERQAVRQSVTPH
jgi:hypothetical protein